MDFLLIYSSRAQKQHNKPMPVHTKLDFCNLDCKTKRTYQTKSFTSTTKTKDIEAFILKKYLNSKPPFNIGILDQRHGYVTLDDDYLEEYKPFDTETIHATTAQSTNSLEPTVKLRIYLPGRSVSSKLSLFL
jgi:hypothetical protein